MKPHHGIRDTSRRLHVEACESRVMLAGDAGGGLVDIFLTTDSAVSDTGVVFRLDASDSFLATISSSAFDSSQINRVWVLGSVDSIGAYELQWSEYHPAQGTPMVLGDKLNQIDPSLLDVGSSTNEPWVTGVYATPGGSLREHLPLPGITAFEIQPQEAILAPASAAAQQTFNFLMAPGEAAPAGRPSTIIPFATLLRGAGSDFVGGGESRPFLEDQSPEQLALETAAPDPTAQVMPQSSAAFKAYSGVSWARMWAFETASLPSQPVMQTQAAETSDRNTEPQARDHERRADDLSAIDAERLGGIHPHSLTEIAAVAVDAETSAEEPTRATREEAFVELKHYLFGSDAWPALLDRRSSAIGPIASAAAISGWWLMTSRADRAYGDYDRDRSERPTRPPQ